jgi:hypothetical protein
LANKPECEGVNYIRGDTHESTKPIVCKYSKWWNLSFWFIYWKIRFNYSKRKKVSDIYELIEVDSNIKPDAKIANLLKEKNLFIKNK